MRHETTHKHSSRGAPISYPYTRACQHFLQKSSPARRYGQLPLHPPREKSQRKHVWIVTLSVVPTRTVSGTRILNETPSASSRYGTFSPWSPSFTTYCTGLCAGFRAGELRDEGFTADELREAGFDIE